MHPNNKHFTQIESLASLAMQECLMRLCRELKAVVSEGSKGLASYLISTWAANKTSTQLNRAPGARLGVA